MIIDIAKIKALASACPDRDQVSVGTPEHQHILEWMGYVLHTFVHDECMALALIGEIERLQAENERFRKLPTCWSEVISQSEENDDLLNQVLELSADADRYRYLCRNAQMLGMIEEGESIEELSSLIDQGLAKELGQ
ncbi:hypothetical protein M9Y56_09255 [Pseudomonas juntendi]|uniref:hypothetical protein n=1 Tax=Pseudomonas juntendi TaxID=2666183 RepID=UPI000CE5708A|nr:hypothetical protein [Pseudomonas juntendi]MCL8329302.1 hypothetical protein [Pseudomonas juntendi]PPB17428.1 hypothetical protein HV87_23580 [Pseudomonas aeruginosa]